MTDIEKAKAYDEALERAKELYIPAKRENSPAWASYEYIFPELSESEKYDGNMDEECIKLCNILNKLPGVRTFESCCGHLKDKYSIWFFCEDIDSLSRLGRCVERNYSDGKWELLVDSTDTHPRGVFWLRSKEPFATIDEMNRSVTLLIQSITHWFEQQFDAYFNLEPEDSEDERIRKVIVKHFKELHENSFINLEIPDILAWLEKKKRLNLVEAEIPKGIKENKYLKARFLWKLMHEGIITAVDYLYLTDDKRRPWTQEEYCKAYRDGFDVSEQLKQTGQKAPKTALEAWKEMRLEVFAQSSGNRHEHNCSDDTSKMFSLNDIDEIFEKIADL